MGSIGKVEAYLYPIGLSGRDGTIEPLDPFWSPKRD